MLGSSGKKAYIQRKTAGYWCWLRKSERMNKNLERQIAFDGRLLSQLWRGWSRPLTKQLLEWGPNLRTYLFVISVELIVANAPINAPAITIIRESNELPRKLGTVDITWLARTPPLEAMKRTVAILKESKDLFPLALGLMSLELLRRQTISYALFNSKTMRWMDSSSGRIRQATPFCLHSPGHSLTKP